MGQFAGVRDPFLVELTNMRAENASLAREIQRFEDLYRHLVVEFVKLIEQKPNDHKALLELMAFSKD